MPNVSMPPAASSASINRQCRASISPDAPRVVIESSEYSTASGSEATVPSKNMSDQQRRYDEHAGGLPAKPDHRLEQCETNYHRTECV
jgi:hypothetical protein